MNTRENLRYHDSSSFLYSNAIIRCLVIDIAEFFSVGLIQNIFNHRPKPTQYYILSYTDDYPKFFETYMIFFYNLFKYN